MRKKSQTASLQLKEMFYPVQAALSKFNNLKLMKLSTLNFLFWDALKTTLSMLTLWRKGVLKHKPGAEANLKVWKCHH